MKKTRALSLFLAAGLLTASFALGQAALSRVKVKFKTSAGKAIPAVKVTATCEDEGTCKEKSGFTKELVADKWGEVFFGVADNKPRTYHLLFEAEGFLPREEDVDMRLRQDFVREVTLVTREEMAQVDAENAEGGVPAAAPSPEQKIISEAVQAARTGELDTARAKILEALELNPENGEAHRALAGFHFQEKDYAAAVREGEEALRLGATNDELYRVLYESHTELGDTKAAKAVIAELDKSGKADPVVIYNEGVIAFKNGDTATARLRFERALELDDDLVEAMRALAGIYLQHESYVEAAAMTERLLIHQPDDQALLRARWDAYRMADNEGKA